jgi:hypothetical protein
MRTCSTRSRQSMPLSRRVRPRSKRSGARSSRCPRTRWSGLGMQSVGGARREPFRLQSSLPRHTLLTRTKGPHGITIPGLGPAIVGTTIPSIPLPRFLMPAWRGHPVRLVGLALRRDTRHTAADTMRDQLAGLRRATSPSRPRDSGAIDHEMVLLLSTADLRDTMPTRSHPLPRTVHLNHLCIPRPRLSRSRTGPPLPHHTLPTGTSRERTTHLTLPRLPPRKGTHTLSLLMLRRQPRPTVPMAARTAPPRPGVPVVRVLTITLLPLQPRMAITASRRIKAHTPNPSLLLPATGTDPATATTRATRSAPTPLPSQTRPTRTPLPFLDLDRRTDPPLPHSTRPPSPLHLLSWSISTPPYLPPPLAASASAGWTISTPLHRQVSAATRSPRARSPGRQRSTSRSGHCKSRTRPDMMMISCGSRLLQREGRVWPSRRCWGVRSRSISPEHRGMGVRR